MFRLLSRLLPILVLLAACRPLPAPQAESPDAEIRAVWVTRWDYRSPEDVRAIVANCDAAGFNRLYFQVRGEATTFYPSKLEPWAWELTSKSPATTGQDPGWDPLALALSEARARGLELHAYVNVLPVWKHEQLPPRNSGHLLVARPDWIMVDTDGRRMDPRRLGFYAFLNPVLPEVRLHLARVFEELATNYPALDGIHYDYIRYPGEKGDYSHDPASLAAFKQASGGIAPSQAPQLWNRWRADQVNLLLADLGRTLRRVNPQLEISAAVVASYDEAVSNRAQRSLDWPGLGLVQTLAPMAYHYDMDAYRAYLDTFLGPRGPRSGRVVVGLYPAEKWEARGFDQAMLLEQIEAARARGAAGVALFSYERFFPGHRANDWARFLRARCFND